MNKNKLGSLVLSIALLSSAYTANAQTVDSCGYTVDTGIYSSWGGGYQAWVSVNNVSGEPAIDFEVLIDTGSSSLASGYTADFRNGSGGVIASAPDWLQWSAIQPGSSFEFGFLGSGEYSGIGVEMLSVNGESCGGSQADTVSPQSGLTVNQAVFTSPGTLELTAFAVDNVAVDKVVFRRNGQVIGEDSTDPYSFNLAIDNSTPDGVSYFTAIAYDTSGNSGESNEIGVSVELEDQDTISPQAGLSVNQAVFTSPGTLMLSAFAADNVGIEKVVFLRDGQVISEDTSDPYSFDVVIDENDPNGVSYYTAIAYDPSGNTGLSNEIGISVEIEQGDTINPQAGLSVNQAVFTSAGTLELMAFAADNVGIAKVVFMRDGQVISEDTSEPYGVDVSIGASDPNGVSYFSAVAYDLAGNSGVSNEIGVSISIEGGDSISPQTGLSVNQAVFTSPGTLELMAFAADNVGIAKVVFMRDGQVISEDTTEPYGMNVSIGANDPEGVSYFSVIAYDPSGNTGVSNEIGVSISIEGGDSISPQAGLSINQDAFTSPGILVLNAFAADNVGIAKVVFMRDGQVINEDTTAPYNFEVIIDQSTANGISYYSAVAYDPSGNTGASNEIGVSVELVQQDDVISPEAGLNVNQTEFTGPGTLILSAFAVDNVGVAKVVFLQDGDIIGEDSTSPYEYEISYGNGASGTSYFSVVAYDTSGNSKVSNEIPVTVIASDRFLGTAVGSEDDFLDAAMYFNQITPEDAGKWGVVEAERNVMDWSGLDAAYEFAKQNDMPFKLHTLVWGQQAPAWLAGLDPDEQVSEMYQWILALSERYPDVDMVDVVNEPLHAPPSFREALGGDGESGWSWVISAFAMTRSLFPEATLMINEYNVLIQENFTYEYIDVIQAVQQTGMLDAVGVQAHFLERADVSVVAANLQTLADTTGLPIYVTELDVDLADDARHANVLKDLFTTFWENPAVAGVTHWGHLEGSMWRENAYLVRADGSERPGLEWLQCYYSGAVGCSVPEYIPIPWVGDDNGLTLPAELYDDAQGLIALGNTVAYTDDADWLSYNRVNFQENWDTLWVTYVKGSDTEASISIHLDSLDSPAVATVDLAPLADWSASETLELPWVGISGEHDVYVRFNGTTAVANLDELRFGRPTTTNLGANLVANSDFEEGNIGGWYTWDGDVDVTSATVYEGNYSLQLTNRTDTGPLAYGLFDDVVAGSTYRVSMQVTIGGTEPADVNVTRKMACNGEDDDYAWLVNPVTVNPGEWVELAADLVVTDCMLTDVSFFLEGPAPGIDIFVDTVSIQEVTVVSP